MMSIPKGSQWIDSQSNSAQLINNNYFEICLNGDQTRTTFDIKTGKKRNFIKRFGLTTFIS